MHSFTSLQKNCVSIVLKFTIAWICGTFLMFLLFLVFCLWQFSYGSLGATNNSVTNIGTMWFGPSYQPFGWRSLPEDLFSEDFQYEGPRGPQTWAKYFSQCGGKRQSPINIQTKNLIRKKTKNSLKWTNYFNVPGKMFLENSKHSIHVKGTWKNQNDMPYITDGPLKNRYYFSQLHFHWGKNDKTGSEHLVNGLSYPLELHIVHADNLEATEQNSPIQIVVVSIMFEIVKEDNGALSPILEGIKQVQGNVVKESNIKPFPLGDLFKTFKGEYVSYKGSLTTPPCTESVIWVIGPKTLPISQQQLATLRYSVTDKYGNAFGNYRPVQNLNSRNVYFIYC